RARERPLWDRSGRPRGAKTLRETLQRAPGTPSSTQRRVWFRNGVDGGAARGGLVTRKLSLWPFWGRPPGASRLPTASANDDPFARTAESFQCGAAVRFPVGRRAARRGR